VSFPPALRALIDEFAALPWDLKVEYLADYAEHLPVPDRSVSGRIFAPVPECQSPMAYHVEVAADGTVQLLFAVSAHAVTAHGYLGLLHAGLNGESCDAILAIDADIPDALGLSEQLSPQRLVGLRAVVFRLQQTLAARR